MNTLVLDVGGKNIKVGLSGLEEVRKVPTGAKMSPAQMMAGVIEVTKDWQFDRISVGFPAPVIKGKIMLEPKNLGTGWLDFDFAAFFGKPFKLVNDAAMQALGSYEGGRMLFLGLGTGLGTALVIDNVVISLEFAHVPYRKEMTYEDFLGHRGLLQLGPKKWRETVGEIVEHLKAGFIADYVVLGGGNAKKLKTIPAGVRLGSNKNAMLGGFRMWENTTIT